MILVLGLGFSVDAGALANRVFVSARSGSDLNTCDNINAPCQTFAGAVTKLNPGGEAIVLDSGGYGAVTIGQALTIEAPPGVLAFVHPSSGDGITVAAGVSDTVVLRGIVLNGGAGNGIFVSQVGVLHIENCVVSGFVNGLAYAAAGGRLFIKDTIIRNNTFDGIFVQTGSGTPMLSLDRCRLEGNAANGLEIHRGSTTIRDSVTSGNNVGFHAVGFASALDLNIESCLVANNTVAGISSDNPTATVRVSDTTVTGNAFGLEQFGGGLLLSRSNNTVEGNGTNGTFTGTYLPK